MPAVGLIAVIPGRLILVERSEAAHAAAVASTHNLTDPLLSPRLHIWCVRAFLELFPANDRVPLVPGNY